MSTEEILRKKLRRTPSAAVRISRDSFKTRRDENRSNKDGFFDRDNGYKGKLNKNVNFKGKQYGEERSGEKFYERGEFRTSRNDENFDRENGYKGKLKKNVNFERSGEKFTESGKLRNLDSFGRKKRVYAKEGMDESVELWGGVETSKKKTLFKKREKKVRDKNGEGKTKERTMWVRDKSKNVGSKDKISNHSLKDKKESDVLVTAKHKIKAMESGIDDGLKKIRDKKYDFGKEKSQEVDSPSFVKKQIRDKAGLDDDAERQDGRRWKKKKRVMKIDPYDISNKRLDDAIGIEGSTEEPKKKDSLEELEISNRAQFRAIVPSPSILTFVEKNLLGRRRMIDIKRAGYNIELPAPLDNIPFSKSSERENVEENIFRNRMEFFAAAKVSSSFPPPNLPEIAFAGKSNVGKSSLLNALTRQWGVVRTSPKPGHTQTINFFNLGTKLCLVDLPGYGFAYAKEEVKEAWDDLVKEYVSTRVGLKRVCLLIDSKWGLKPRDHELITLMERSKTNYQIVLTKTDTVFPIDVARRAMQIEEILLPNKSVVHPLMMASSKSGAGIRSLRTVLANVARFVKI